MQKDLKSLVDRAKEQGWTDKPVKGGLLLLAPDGVGKVTLQGVEGSLVSGCSFEGAQS